MLMSGLSVISWLWVSAILGEWALVMFTLTYTVQLILDLISHVIQDTPNMLQNESSAARNDLRNSGLLVSIILTAIICLVFIWKTQWFLEFLSVGAEQYAILYVYSISQLGFRTMLWGVLTNMFYREQNKEANHISLIYNLISTLLFPALLTLGITLTWSVMLAVTALALLTLYYVAREFVDFRLVWPAHKILKRARLRLISSMGLILTYLVGFHYAYSFGLEWIAVINVTALLTDPAWDATAAVATAARIDISLHKYDLRVSIKHGLLLITIFAGGITLMAVPVIAFMNINITLLLIGLAIHIVTMYMDVFSMLLEALLFYKLHSPLPTCVKLLSQAGRVSTSFLRTPWNTYIGLVLVSVLVPTSYGIALYRRKYK